MPLIKNFGMRISPHCTWRNVVEIHAVWPILKILYGATYEMTTSGWTLCSTYDLIYTLFKLCLNSYKMVKKQHYGGWKLPSRYVWSHFFVLSFHFSFPLSPSFPIESLSHGVEGGGGPGQGKGEERKVCFSRVDNIPRAWIFLHTINRRATTWAVDYYSSLE